jgi:hypothetical protein
VHRPEAALASPENDRSRRPPLSLRTSDRGARRIIEGARELALLRTCPGCSLRRWPGALSLPKPVPIDSLTQSGSAERLAPNILSADHWHRLLDGELYASCSTPEWALLLKRTFRGGCSGVRSVRRTPHPPRARHGPRDGEQDPVGSRTHTRFAERRVSRAPPGRPVARSHASTPCFVPPPDRSTGLPPVLYGSCGTALGRLRLRRYRWIS